MTISNTQSPSVARRPFFPAEHAAPIFLLWLAVFMASLFSPPLLDDADATHAQAARAIATTDDWVTLHVNGIRYLEKAPLPYWLGSISFRLFGFNTFALHLPLALAVLALAALGYLLARQAFDERTALYTSLATLTCTGVFLFTRIFIPEVLLSLFLCLALYSFLHALEQPPTPATHSSRLEPPTPGAPSSLLEPPTPGAPSSPRAFARLGWASPYLMWTALALAVLTKGLVTLVFFFATICLYLAITGNLGQWRKLRPFTGLALFLLIAAPWHILASVRNPGPAGGHGFAWFYFINEHVLRFLGRRIPRDYNKLPTLLYWSLHLIWLFPWSLFAPAAAILGWRSRHSWRSSPLTYAKRTAILLCIYTAFVLLFFAFSTNQEYYTFPVYLPLLLLLCAGIARAEYAFDTDGTLRRWLLASHIAFTIIGVSVAATLAWLLWRTRHLSTTADIGALLAHRAVGNYTLSMSHFFDLTGPSFAALRLPAALAALALTFGPAAAWDFRRKRSHILATTAIALTSAVFLIAAHIALTRFAPLLSSKAIATKIQQLRTAHAVAPDTQVLLFGDQAFGSSIPFYLGEQVSLVDGRSTSMLFGSTFPDAPPIFLTSQDLLAQWGKGSRKLLFVPAEQRAEADRLLGSHQLILQEISSKALITDRPLEQSGLKPEPH